MTNEIYPCVIRKTNKMGFLVEPLEKPNPLVIVVAKQHVENKSLLNLLQECDYVSIKIIGSRFDLGDDKISVVATITGKLNTSDIPAFLLLKNEKNECEEDKKKIKSF